MLSKYHHIYLELANKKVFWLPMDTEELYLENLKKRYEELKKYGWVNNNFTYEFNSFGFRCSEFTNDPTIMFLGCSQTIGIGLPLENLWPELVSKKLNLKCANLGIGGGSIDTAFRMCHGYIDKIKPKIVVFMKPPGLRIEILKEDVIHVHSAHSTGGAKKSNVFNEFLENDANEFFQYEKNTLAMRHLCYTKKIKFITVDSADYHRVDFARDLGHFGKETCRIIAKSVIDKISLDTTNF